jgi:subtilisin family serine protease
VQRILIAGLLSIVFLAGAGAGTADAALDPLRNVQWALDAIHLGDLGSRTQQPAPTGQGVIVAVIDSGVEASHPDLRGRVIQGPDLVDGPGGPDDPNGHGTHMAGIIAAASDNGIGGAGVASAAQILAIRVLDESNVGTPADVAGGIDAAIAGGADVINLSLNWPRPSAALVPVTAAMQRAADAGIAVIVASGNDAQPRCEEPVLADRTLCVGAVDGDMRRAPFSSHGSGLGIVAPGEDVVSTWRGADYTSVSGTSQAAAVTSGVAALLAGLGLRGQAVIDRLIQTARDIGTPGPDDASGHGLLDADRAVEGAAQGTVPPLLRLRTPQRVSASTLRRRGLKVDCDAARPGTCRVRVRVGGVVVAKGERRADGSGVVAVVARATVAGRRLLRTTRSRGAVVVAGLDGAPGARAALTLRSR